MQTQACSELGWESCSLDQFTRHRNSDTLYVLGSGSSIVSLSPEHWACIKSADSFGMNFWLVHPHVPSYFCFEMPRVAKVRDWLLCNMLHRAEDYRDTRAVFKISREYFEDREGKRELARVAKCFQAFVPTFFTASDGKGLEALLRHYGSITKSLRKKDDSAFFRKRASVVFATMFASELGFKNIVLCGIDGTPGSGYFYESGNDTNITAGAVVPESSGQMPGRVHKTMDTQLNPLGVRECLEMIDRLLLKPSGVGLWLGTSGSALADVIPAWHWPVELAERSDL